MHKSRNIIVFLLLLTQTTCHARFGTVGSAITLYNESPVSLKIVDTSGDKSQWKKTDLEPGQSMWTSGFNSGYFVRAAPVKKGSSLELEGDLWA